MKDCVKFNNRYLSKEDRDKAELDYLFEHRYDDTFDAIGYEWDTDEDELIASYFYEEE